MSIYLNHMDFRRLEPLRQPPGGGGGGGVPRLRHRFKFNQTDCLGAVTSMSRVGSVTFC